MSGDTEHSDYDSFLDELEASGELPYPTDKLVIEVYNLNDEVLEEEIEDIFGPDNYRERNSDTYEGTKLSIGGIPGVMGSVLLQEDEIDRDNIREVLEN